jgi:hypothetical protein
LKKKGGWVKGKDNRKTCIDDIKRGEKREGWDDHPNYKGKEEIRRKERKMQKKGRSEMVEMYNV